MMDDLISRSALNKEMLFNLNQEITKYKTMRRTLGNVARSALDCVKAAPAVDAEPVRHGRWIRLGPNWYECSACKERTSIFSGAKNYCPNCGAKMMDGDEHAAD